MPLSFDYAQAPWRAIDALSAVMSPDQLGAAAVTLRELETTDEFAAALFQDIAAELDRRARRTQRGARTIP